MAEVNCPMCGKPNSEEAETCVHCGARLKPLTGGEPVSDWSSGSETPAGESQGRERSEGGPAAGGEPADLAGSVADEGPNQEQELAGGEVPGWLQRIRHRQAEDAEQEASGIDQLRAGLVEQAEAADKQPDREPEDPRAGFPGLSDGTGDFDDEAESESHEPEREGVDLRAAFPGLSAGTDDIDEQEDEPKPASPRVSPPAREQPPAAEQPTPASEQPPDDDSGLPHVQALIGAEEADLDAEELGLPDWLGEIEPLEDEPDAEPKRRKPEPAGGLERATLPNWLEAMRPVDTFRSVVEIDSEDDQAIESVGPLAGLRGVLMAEPVVAMPRSSTTGAMQLEVSERQYAQAELLHRMITEEESSAPAAPKRRRRLSLFRWAIAALTLVAAALPILTGAPGFALPSLEPKELGPLFNLVQDLPTDQPTLFVFDYDPGNAGELDAVSGALLDQVMSRNLPVATVSTRPTGSPLAERATRDLAIQHGYAPGSDLVHLGYLSGGPAAVQLFALSPRSAILKGFALPESMTEAGEGAWDSPMLANVNALSDFSLVTVITAGSETARVWVEQAEPYMDNQPLVMVLSAGAEPLVRPYYESSRPQLSGILTGLPAAVAYEQRNGRFGPALDRWNSFGSGMLAAELVLVAGAGYGLVRWIMRRREG